MDFTVELNTSIPLLSLAVASEPYDYLPEQYKRYFPAIYMYNFEGECLGKHELKDGDKSKFAAFLKGAVPDRDKLLKENDDSRIVINIGAIPPEVASLILAVREDPLNKNAKETWYGNARYRLLDEDTYQSVEYERLGQILEKAIRVGEPAGEDTSQEARVAVCGRLYVEDSKDRRWTYEAYHTALSGKKADIDAKITGLGALVKREDLPSIDTAKWDEEYAQQKAAASKGKGKGKREDTRAGKSQSKLDDKKNKSKSKAQKEEDESEEKKEEEETLQQKLEGFADFPIGPIELDCEESADKIQQKIVEAFATADKQLFEICAQQGVEVFVRDRQLRSGKQLLNHSHILRQVVIRPKAPQIIPPAEVPHEGDVEPIAEDKKEDPEDQ